MNGQKVLIADDEPTLRQLLQTNFMLEGFATCEASDGAEALAALDAEHPDVVVLDIMMPGVDGFQVLDSLEEGSPPVVVLSAKASSEDQVHGYELGCDAYITKPFDVDTLIDKIRLLAVASPEERKELRRQAIEMLLAAE